MPSTRFASTNGEFLSFTFALTITVLMSFQLANGQTPPSSAEQTQKSPTVVTLPDRPPAAVAGRTALYCGGYIRFDPFPEQPEIVGGEQEQEQRIYSQGNYVYLNAGSQQGIKEGQEFTVIRPRGEMKGVYRNKKNPLGIYVQEVGQLKVTTVNERVSVGQIVYACGEILLGDLLTDVPARTSPTRRPETVLDRFSAPSGKQTGRVMMTRGGREMPTTNDIIYIDLGGEDHINTGEYLTIYREVGTGNVTRVDNEEIARGMSRGFESNRYRGGEFGIQAQRGKDSTGFVSTKGTYKYRPITTREIKRHRPTLPRKVVGEAVILSVQARTATAVITRVAQEVHTGDFVEIQ